MNLLYTVFTGILDNKINLRSSGYLFYADPHRDEFTVYGTGTVPLRNYEIKNATVSVLASKCKLYLPNVSISRAEYSVYYHGKDLNMSTLSTFAALKKLVGNISRLTREYLFGIDGGQSINTFFLIGTDPLGGVRLYYTLL
jgi:hypothetical protein